MALQRYTTHVRLSNPSGATRYALPGVGAPPDFAIPVKAVRIEDIVGARVIKLREDPDGGYSIPYEERINAAGVRQKEPMVSPVPVTCLIDPQGHPMTHGLLECISDEWGDVTVYFDSKYRAGTELDKACR